MKNTTHKLYLNHGCTYSTMEFIEQEDGRMKVVRNFDYEKYVMLDKPAARKLWAELVAGKWATKEPQE